VNRTTGRPKLLRRKPFNLYPAPQSATTLSIAATPAGRFVFIGDQSGAVIHALSVSKKGRMAAVPGSPFATPDFGYVIRMQVTFDGRLLAAALSGTQKFAVFRIGDDGALASPPGGADPGDSTAGAGISVAFSCAGDRLFAVQASLDRGPIVNVYDVADDGSLASVTGSPFSPGPTANPVYATTSADGGFLFVGYFGLGIASYRIAANGSLSMVAGSPFPLGADGFTRDGPCNFMPDASGRFLYAAAGGLGGIYTVRILNDGSMAALPGSPLQASGSTSIVVAPPAVCEELSIASQRFKTVHTLETRLERYRRNRIAPALVTAPN
jgi:6-phosphogluconolactonase (cycloisomerase 2 family)